MKNALLHLCVLIILSMLTQPIFADDDGSPRGLLLSLDGSFNYQGHLEVDGQPANGDYFFRFSIYNSADIWLGAIYSETLSPITVTNGLFNVDVQMGGNTVMARDFWSSFGQFAKTMEIEISEDQITWTALSPRVSLGSSPHALHAIYSEESEESVKAQSLVFPYSQTVSTPIFSSPSFHLTEASNGILAQFDALVASSSGALVRINGAEQTNIYFTPDNGLLRVDSATDKIGIMSTTGLYPIYGSLSVGNGGNPTDPDAIAVLGRVSILGTQSGNRAIVGINDRSGNSAALGTQDYAGDFDGDVLARNDLRVQGVPTRDYAPNNPSPIGPLAYASVNPDGSLSSGTGNIVTSWDNTNQWYLISIPGVNLHPSTHTTSVTVIELNEPRVATVATTQGKLIVRLWDLNSGNAVVQDSFSIVIYDANPSALNAANGSSSILDPVKPFQLPKAELIEEN